jgi:hypothetical protein
MTPVTFWEMSDATGPHAPLLVLGGGGYAISIVFGLTFEGIPELGG